MNLDVSERAFEDAIEAALIRPDIVVAEQRDSYDDMPPRRVFEAHLRGLRQEPLPYPAQRSGLRPGNAAP